MAHDARLLFDSDRAGSIVGTRGLAGNERTLLFRAGTVSIDLFLTPASRDLTVLYGQVVDDSGARPLADTRVRLTPGGDEVRTDRFGQFTVSALGGTDGRTLHLEGDDWDVACALSASPAGRSQHDG